MTQLLLSVGRVLLTGLAVVAAVLGIRSLWIRNQMDPWTRDGRVRADVVQLAPDVSGLVAEVRVHDNEAVAQGQVLFVIDQARYKLALAEAQATVAMQRTLLAQALREDKRNHSLGELVPGETTEQGSAKVAQLRATLDQAIARRDQAVLNLDRTTVTASVDGVVTNMELRPGDYLTAGRQAMALVYTRSLHVDGYFEETKLPVIHPGDEARVELMGVVEPLKGHVESISGAIEDRERAPGSSLLANVNPTFSWVRLPQRIPVRIALDLVPPGVQLVPGQTTSVEVLPRAGQPAVRRSFLW